MRYRRNLVSGGSFFFTVVTDNRRPILTTHNSIAVLREAFRTVRAKKPFHIDAIVVLPDHIHCIWTLPTDDNDYSLRWRLIKTWFTKHCHRSLRAYPGNTRAARGEQAIWQRRFWEHTLRDEDDFSRHADYIHYNPVKHGYVSETLAWPYSSFHRYVESGVYLKNWSCSDQDFAGIENE